MVQYIIKINNPSGLHARPASQLAKWCKGFPETIYFINEGRKVDGKSIISILSGGFTQGTEITVQVEGKNEQETCEKVCSFIANLRD